MRLFLQLLLILFCERACGYELAIATLFRNVAPQLEEWITYHQMVGVDHFWLYNDESNDEWEQVLQPFIAAGVVEVFPWKASKPFWGVEQRAAIRDGIRRAQQTHTRWIALIDVDEFLLPMQEKTMVACLDKNFAKAGGVYLNWRNFGTNHLTLSPHDSLLYRLTACSTRNHPRNWVGKSILSPSLVDCERCDYVHHFPLVAGAYYLDGDGNKIPMEKGRIKHDSAVHDRFARINHYPLLDEEYFHHVRVPRDRSIGNSKDSFDWYQAFNQEQDRAILEFIQKKHPENYRSYWKKKGR